MQNVFFDWLHQRKITDDVIKEFNIHTTIHPYLGECFVIPITTPRGDFSFNKYRRSPLVDTGPKYIYDKGGHLTLFGAHKIRDKSHILITEGEMDSLVAWSANIPAVSSTGGAMSFSPDWFDLLLDKEVTLCFDNDPSGGEGMARALDILPHARILFLPDRAGVKDISDYVTNGGDLHAFLKTAKYFSNLEDVLTDRAERLSLWKNVFFHDAYIRNHTDKPVTPSLFKQTGEGLIRAKQFPISRLLDFKQKKTLCLWHNDTSPSLHYFDKDNHVYCFACGKIADAIDVYQQLHNVSFKEAIKKLQ